MTEKKRVEADPPLEFSIKKLRVLQKGSLLAGLTITVNKVLELNDCKLVQGSKGRFVSAPSRQYEKDGVTKYANYFFMPFHINDIVSKIASDAYDKALLESPKQAGSAKAEAPAPEDGEEYPQ